MDFVWVRVFKPSSWKENLNGTKDGLEPHTCYKVFTVIVKICCVKLVWFMWAVLQHFLQLMCRCRPSADKCVHGISCLHSLLTHYLSTASITLIDYHNITLYDKFSTKRDEISIFIAQLVSLLIYSRTTTEICIGIENIINTNR